MKVFPLPDAILTPFSLLNSFYII